MDLKAILSGSIKKVEINQEYIDSEFPPERILTPREAFSLGANHVWLYDIDGNGVAINHPDHQLSDMLGRILQSGILDDGSIEVTLESIGDVKQNRTPEPQPEVETPVAPKITPATKPQQDRPQKQNTSNIHPTPKIKTEVIEAAIAGYETPSLTSLLQQQVHKPREVRFDKFQLVISNMTKYYPVVLYIIDWPELDELVRNLPHPKDIPMQNREEEFNVFKLGLVKVLPYGAQQIDKPKVLTLEDFIDFHVGNTRQDDDEMQSVTYEDLAKDVHNEHEVVTPTADILKNAFGSIYEYFTRSNAHYEIEDLCPTYLKEESPTISDIELPSGKIDEIRDLVADLNNSGIQPLHNTTIFDVILFFVQSVLSKLKEFEAQPEILEISDAELDDLKAIADRMEREIHQPIFGSTAGIEPSKTLANRILQGNCNVVIKPIKMPMRPERKT